jgi:hypothetical protein
LSARKRICFHVLAAVGRAIDAAIFVRREGIAEGGDVNDVGIGGVDANGRDLAGVAQTGEGPSLARVRGFVDAAADRDVRADLRRSGAGVDDVGIRERDFDCAHGADGEIRVRDVLPGVACVGGFPDAAAGRAHVKGVRFGGNAGDGGDASAAFGADHAVAHRGPDGGLGGEGRGEEEGEESDSSKHGRSFHHIRRLKATPIPDLNLG